MVDKLQPLHVFTANIMGEIAHQSIFKILGYEIQDVRTSISINLKFEQPLLEEMVMKVTNIYKHEIVDTHA